MLGAQWRYGYVHTRCKKVLLKKVLSFIRSVTFQSKEKRNHKHYLFPYVIWAIEKIEVNTYKIDKSVLQLKMKFVALNIWKRQ